MYLNRKAQRAYLQSKGIELGDSALENMASDGTGPHYVIINGRALSTEQWLDDWVLRQTTKPVIRRRQRSVGQDAAASRGAA